MHVIIEILPFCWQRHIEKLSFNEKEMKDSNLKIPPLFGSSGWWVLWKWTGYLIRKFTVSNAYKLALKQNRDSIYGTGGNGHLCALAAGCMLAARCVCRCCHDTALNHQWSQTRKGCCWYWAFGKRKTRQVKTHKITRDAKVYSNKLIVLVPKGKQQAHNPAD